MKSFWVIGLFLGGCLSAKSQVMASLIKEQTKTDIQTLDDSKNALYWHNVIPGSFQKPVIANEKSFFYPLYLQAYNFSIQSSFDKSYQGISGTDVINKFLSAIGNTDSLNHIKNVVFDGKIQINKVTLGFHERKQSPNLDYIALSIDRDTVMRSVFDGKAGYNQHVSEQVPLTPFEIEERNKDYLGIFNQLYYLNSRNHFYLTDIREDTVIQEKCFRLDIQMPSGKLVSEFYSQQSFLLIKSIESDPKDNNIGKITTKTFSKYKPYKNLLFPTEIKILVQSDDLIQNMNLSLQSINCNTDLDED